MTDKYFTKKSTVQLILHSDAVDFSRYDRVVEPSAGAGAFSIAIEPHLQDSQVLIAVDIEPEHESIKKFDFLNQSLSCLKKAKTAIIIGNPPYGRGKTPLAVAFFNRAAEYEAVETIAFILPKSFRKDSVQDRLDSHFWLQREVEIPDRSFEYDDKTRGHPRLACVFQVWERRAKQRPRSIRHPLREEWYQFLQKPCYGQAVVQIKRVGSSAGQLELLRMKRNKTYSFGAHFYLLSKLLDAEELYQALKQVNWSTDNTLLNSTTITNQK